jgi:hypothetical protein
MSAVLKQRYRRVKTEMLENIKHGAPLEDYTLEPDECVRWIAEEESKWDLSVALAMNWHEAIGELAFDKTKVKTFERLDALLEKLMLGTMTADELCEWRDIQRATLIDFCSNWARHEAEQEMPA